MENKKEEICKLNKNEELLEVLTNDKDIKQKELKDEDDDFFDFIEEENNSNKIDANENINTTNDIGTDKKHNGFTLQEKSNYINIDSNKSNSTSTNAANSFLNKQSKNFNLINKLLSEYKQNYLDPNNNYLLVMEESLKIDFKENKISDNEIKSFYLDIDNKNISLKDIIENIPSAKIEPEITLRTLSVEEINKLSSFSSDDKKKKINSEKEIKFKNAISEIGNATIKKLYFKYIDLKNIHVNNLQAQSQTHKTIPNKNLKSNKKDNTSSEKAVENQNNLDNTKLLKEEAGSKIAEVEDKTQKINMSVDKNTFAVQLENTKTNTIIDINQASKKDEDASGEDNEEEEFEEVEEEKNKNAIFIDEVLYSIVMDTNKPQNNDINITNNQIPSIHNNKNIADSLHPPQAEQTRTFDEDKMIEYLKYMTTSNKTFNKNEKESENNLITEEKKNDEIFQKIIDNLPNYNFLLSKYIEYPDSLFSI